MSYSFLFKSSRVGNLLRTMATSKKPCVCIYFTSEEGQTEKIADHISEGLKKLNIDVQVNNIKKLEKQHKPTGCDGIIVGGSVHSGHYNHLLEQFIKSNLTTLQTTPSSLFAVCGTAIDDPQKAYKDYVETLMKRHTWHPEMATVFAGAYKYSQYGWFNKMMMKYAGEKLHVNDKPVDTSKDYEYTNWESVDHFTSDFAKLIQNKK